MLERKKLEYIYHAPTYISFFRYFYILEELRLIRRVETEKGKAIPKQYYEIIPGTENSPVWTKRNIRNYLYPITKIRKHLYNTLLKPEAEERGITPSEVFAEVPEEYADIARDMDWDLDEVHENLLKLGRTVPHVRRKRRKAETIELRTELEKCKRELKELKAKKPPKKLPTKPKALADAVELFISVMGAIKETENIGAFREIIAETSMITKEWKTIEDKDKRKNM